ncbi:MAG: archaellin/type IV pilin N-terminal domain-containing protein [Candidatus Aenigmatarchaeota archaeon]
MKGVSSIIAMILLLMITISLTGLAYVTFTSFFNTVKDSTETSMTQTMSNMLAQMKIESISKNGGDTVIYIRNIGKVDISRFNAYVNGIMATTRANMPTGNKIVPGSVDNVTITSAVASGATIKITTGQGTVAIQQAP